MNEIPNTALRATGLAAILALSLGLAACNRQDNATVGQKMDAAVQRTEQAAGEVKRDAGNMVDKVRCPSNFVFQRAALMPPWFADPHAC